MDIRARILYASVAITFVFASTVAGRVMAETPPADTRATEPDAEMPNDAGFLNAHPDLRWRTEAMRAYDKQRYEGAMTYFRRAARYADKASQAMIAEMLWNGVGINADHALAYIWMDLAAERGYQAFVVAREQYWAQLSTADQERVAVLGPAIFDEHEDRVAKPRLERILERARKNVTGSRLGVVGPMEVQVRGPSGMISIPAHQYFQSKYWKADEYWDWQDNVWRAPPKGEVRVGPIINSIDSPSP